MITVIFLRLMRCATRLRKLNLICLLNSVERTSVKLARRSTILAREELLIARVWILVVDYDWLRGRVFQVVERRSSREGGVAIRIDCAMTC